MPLIYESVDHDRHHFNPALISATPTDSAGNHIYIEACLKQNEIILEFLWEGEIVQRALNAGSLIDFEVDKRLPRTSWIVTATHRSDDGIDWWLLVPEDVAALNE